MKIHKPIVDEKFEKRVEDFRVIMGMEIRKIDSIRCRVPYYIIEILQGCIDKNRIDFLEYIMYVKLCKTATIFRFWTKKEKILILQNIKEVYNITLDLIEIKKYLDRSFKSIAFELGYEIELNENEETMNSYALIIKKEKNASFMNENSFINDVIKNNKYIYKIVTQNAKEYIVRSEVENVKDFAAYCFEPNKYNDFVLYEDTIDKNRNEIKFNTVMISTNEISSIEYYIARN